MRDASEKRQARTGREALDPALRITVDRATFERWRTAPAWSGPVPGCAADRHPVPAERTVPPFVAVAAAVLSRARSGVELTLRGPLVHLRAQLAVTDDLAAVIVWIELGSQGGSPGDLGWVQVALLPAEAAAGELVRWLPVPRPGEAIAEGTELTVTATAGPAGPARSETLPERGALAHWTAAPGGWRSELAGCAATPDRVQQDLSALLIQSRAGS
ncbi:MAG: hypothetical protein JNL54_15905 [Kineosporiaceae bacterium]|nr:hypothetical protein [Kineosporiaceae bacterium]